MNPLYTFVVVFEGQPLLTSSLSLLSFSLGEVLHVVTGSSSCLVKPGLGQMVAGEGFGK